MPPRFRSMLLAALPLLAGAGALSGCFGSQPSVREEAGYDGPPIAITAVRGNHTLKLTAPTGGWTFQLDETREDYGHRKVLVSVRRPNPSFMVSQALTEHHLMLPVPANVPIRVYARVLPHDAEKSERAWAFAVASETPR